MPSNQNVLILPVGAAAVTAGVTVMGRVSVPTPVVTISATVSPVVVAASTTVPFPLVGATFAPNQILDMEAFYELVGPWVEGTPGQVTAINGASISANGPYYTLFTGVG